MILVDLKRKLQDASTEPNHSIWISIRGEINREERENN